MKDDIDSIRELISDKENLSGSYRSWLEIEDITSSAPYQIPNVRIFRGCYMLNKDPVPYSQWVIVGSDKIYEDMADVLKQLNIIPKSKEEALKLARLIIFAKDRNSNIYPDLDTDTRERYKNILNEPEVSEKENYYEIVLFVSWIKEVKGLCAGKYTFKIGKNYYDEELEIVSLD
ncbi:MAG: hypothetical protein ACETVT_01645 [bacterium]